MKKHKTTITVQITIPFDAANGYEANVIKKMAKKFVKETINNELSYVPFWLKEQGETIECVSRKTEIKIK